MHQSLLVLFNLIILVSDIYNHLTLHRRYAIDFLRDPKFQLYFSWKSILGMAVGGKPGGGR
jgi:hypothetical protein